MTRMMAWMLVSCVGLAQANALAEENGPGETGIEVTYSSGTVPGFRPGTEGKLDATAPESLEFRTNSGVFSIPYPGITAAQYKEENRFRLGVLPAIAVADEGEVKGAFDDDYMEGRAWGGAGSDL